MRILDIFRPRQKEVGEGYLQQNREMFELDSEVEGLLSSMQYKNPIVRIMKSCLKLVDSSSVRVQEVQEWQQINREQLEDPDIWHQPEVHQLVELFCKNKHKYRFPLAMACSHLRYNTLPESTRAALDPRILYGKRIGIKPYYKHWWICGMGEPYFKDAMAKKRVLLVNQYLLTKLEGHTAALCLENFTTDSGRGIFIGGVIYCPMNEDIALGFSQGKSELSQNMGNWVVMRALQRNADTNDRALSYLRADFLSQHSN